MSNTTRLSLILSLLFATAALAGEHNPGPGEDEVVDLWTSQALTPTEISTADLSPARSYPVGLDSGITLDIEIEGAEEGETVTITPTWLRPAGGDPLEEREVQAIEWTQGEITRFLETFAVPRGAQRMYLSGTTSDTNGCTVTVSVIGATNGSGPAASDAFSGDVAETEQGYLTNLGYDGLLHDKDDTDTGITNPSANTVGVQVGGSTLVELGPATGDVLKVTAGTLSSGANALDISATLTDAAGADVGLNLGVTTAAGSSGGDRRAIGVALSGGYSGGDGTVGIILDNSSGSTGTSWYLADSANFGAICNAFGATAGVNVGFQGVAWNSSTLNMGVIGQAPISAAGDNVGGIFVALNGGAGTATGLYVGLDDADPASRLTDVALQVNNDDLAVPIALFQDGNDTLVAMNHAAEDILSITAGNLTSGKQALDVAGTLSSTAATQTLVEFTATPSGSAAALQRVAAITMNAGYTGSERTMGLHLSNNAAGTGTSWYGANGANYGAHLAAGAATAGSNVGFSGFAQQSTDINIGGLGQATTGSAGKNAGGVFIALNSSSGTSTGLYAGLDDSSPTTRLADVAFQASNDSLALPIALFQHGDTTLVRIDHQAEDILTINGGTLTSTKQALDVTGTLPNTAAVQDLVSLTATPTAGSNATLLRTIIANLEAGYTGTARTTAVHGRNVTAGTGTGWYDGNGANYGFYSNSAASTAGSNVGLHSYAASSSDINIGVSGFAITSTGGKNVGIIGIGRNAGAGIGLAAYFGADDADPDGTFADGVVMMSNDDQAIPILSLYDGTTKVGEVVDGGRLQLERGLSLKNFAGVATFSAGTSVTVELSSAMPDTTYVVSVVERDATPSGNQYTYAITDADTFVIHCSASTSDTVGYTTVDY